MNNQLMRCNLFENKLPDKHKCYGPTLAHYQIADNYDVGSAPLAITLPYRECPPAWQRAKSQDRYRSNIGMPKLYGMSLRSPCGMSTIYGMPLRINCGMPTISGMPLRIPCGMPTIYGLPLRTPCGMLMLYRILLRIPWI